MRHCSILTALTISLMALLIIFSGRVLRNKAYTVYGGKKENICIIRKCISYCISLSECLAYYDDLLIHNFEDFIVCKKHGKNLIDAVISITASSDLSFAVWLLYQSNSNMTPSISLAQYAHNVNSMFIRRCPNVETTLCSYREYVRGKMERFE